MGSSINSNVHYHVAVLDGVFTRDADAGVLFHPGLETRKLKSKGQKRATTYLAV